MSKHDFIKQKQSDRETTERQRVSGGECCFHYAEDMSSFGSLPSGCLDAGFTIVLLLLSMHSLVFCHMRSNLSTIHNTIRNSIFISTSVYNNSIHCRDMSPKGQPKIYVYICISTFKNIFLIISFSI